MGLRAVSSSQLQNVVITPAPDDPTAPLVPLVMRGAFVMEGGTSEQECEAIKTNVLQRGGEKLTRWSEMVEMLHPGFVHNIPAARELCLSKLGGGAALTTDTCPQVNLLSQPLIY